MTTKKTEETITEAGAVELNEDQLSDAAGGAMDGIGNVANKFSTAAQKVQGSPTVKFAPTVDNIVIKH